MKQAWIPDVDVNLWENAGVHISHDPNLESIDVRVYHGDMAFEVSIDDAESCRELADAFFRASLWLGDES